MLFFILIFLAVPLAAQNVPNVIVQDSAGGQIATGADFAEVKDHLNGNTAIVSSDFTESAMVTFHDQDVTFSVKSDRNCFFKRQKQFHQQQDKRNRRLADD